MLLDIDINIQFSVSRFSRSFVTQLYRLCSFLLSWLTLTAGPLSWGQVPSLPIPADLTFNPPPPNACQSSYDQFYISERGQAAHNMVKQWTYGPAQFDQTKAGNWSVAPSISSPSSPNAQLSGVLPPWSVSVFLMD
jgi:hypothetical protein